MRFCSTGRKICENFRRESLDYVKAGQTKSAHFLEQAGSKGSIAKFLQLLGGIGQDAGMIGR